MSREKRKESSTWILAARLGEVAEADSQVSRAPSQPKWRSEVNAGRTVPHSPESEENILSCCLLDGAATIAACVETNLPHQAFHTAANRTIYERLRSIYQKDRFVDVGILAESLRDSGDLEAAGGFTNLNRIVGLQSTTAGAKQYAAKVRELYLRRELILTAQRAAERCFDLSGEPNDVIDDLRRQIETVGKLGGIEEKKGYTIFRPSDFAKHVAPNDDGILGEAGGSIYWRDRELALVLGPGGVGKSRIISNVAFCQITGRPLLGFQLLGPPRTWLLTGNENSVARQKTQLAAMMVGTTPAERDLLEKHLLIQALVDDAADSMALDDLTALGLWRATAAKYKPDILVIDPWESVIIGSDCNDSPATRESVRVLRSIFAPHNPRFTPLLVHHAREGAQAARSAEGFDAGAYAKGSKTLRSMARFGLNIAPEDPDDGGRVVLTCGKINDARKFNTRGAVLDETTHFYALNHDFDLDAWRSDVEGKRSNKACSVRDVYEAVRSGVHKAGEIIAAVEASTGASRRAINSRINDACEHGCIKKCPPRGNYTLGDKPLTGGTL